MAVKQRMRVSEEHMSLAKTDLESTAFTILDKLIHRIAMALASGDRVNSIGAYLRLTTLIAWALNKF